MIYGPDLKIPYAATAFVTKRSVIAKRPQVVGNFMRAMAETAKIMHTDREFVYKVLGKYLRITDRSVLDSAYNAEIKRSSRDCDQDRGVAGDSRRSSPNRSTGKESQTARTHRRVAIWTKWTKRIHGSTLGKKKEL